MTLIAGYALFITFFQREGARYFKAHTEIALAQEIHRALVPKIERTIGAVFDLRGIVPQRRSGRRSRGCGGPAREPRERCHLDGLCGRCFGTWRVGGRADGDVQDGGANLSDRA